jgi:hypothetical protein
MRQLLRLETNALESHAGLRFLQEPERQKLESGNCRCYLARDSDGAVTLFLTLTFGGAECTQAAQAEYSHSLAATEGASTLRESGLDDPNTVTRADEKRTTDDGNHVPGQRNG